MSTLWFIALFYFVLSTADYNITRIKLVQLEKEINKQNPVHVVKEPKNFTNKCKEITLRNLLLKCYIYNLKPTIEYMHKPSFTREKIVKGKVVIDKKFLNIHYGYELFTKIYVKSELRKITITYYLLERLKQGDRINTNLLSGTTNVSRLAHHIKVLPTCKKIGPKELIVDYISFPKLYNIQENNNRDLLLGDTNKLNITDQTKLLPICKKISLEQLIINCIPSPELYKSNGDNQNNPNSDTYNKYNLTDILFHNSIVNKSNFHSVGNNDIEDLLSILFSSNKIIFTKHIVKMYYFYMLSITQKLISDTYNYIVGLIPTINQYIVKDFINLIIKLINYVYNNLHKLLSFTSYYVTKLTRLGFILLFKTVKKIINFIIDCFNQA